MRPGYKQTEVGIIPEDWEVENLQNVCREPITYGIVQCGPHVRDGVPYVRVSDMDSQELSVDGMLRTSKVIAAKFGRSTVAAGDLVYALRGKVGEVREVTTEIAGANLTQGTARLSPGEKVASKYLLWAMRHPGTVQQASLDAKGTTFREITLADLRNLKILVPPPPEQRAIAEALSDVDGLLAALDRLIAKKRDLKQAAMQQLLTGQTRLPGSHGDWEYATLGELFTFKNGLNKGKQFFGYGTPIVNFMDVFENAGILSCELRGRVSLSNQEHTNFDVRKGDVLFTRTSETREEIGMAAVILDDPYLTVFSGFLLRGRPKNDRLVDIFKAYCFRSAFVRKQIISKASYTTRALTNGRILSCIILPMPPIPEQTAIAEVLTDMDAELATLEQRREKTRLLKQAMMQELLTGRTRLVPPGGRE